MAGGALRCTEFETPSISINDDGSKGTEKLSGKRRSTICFNILRFFFYSLLSCKKINIYSSSSRNLLVIKLKNMSLCDWT